MLFLYIVHLILVEIPVNVNHNLNFKLILIKNPRQKTLPGKIILLDGEQLLDGSPGGVLLGTLLAAAGAKAHHLAVEGNLHLEVRPVCISGVIHHRENML